MYRLIFYKDAKHQIIDFIKEFENLDLCNIYIDFLYKKLIKKNKKNTFQNAFKFEFYQLFSVKPIHSKHFILNFD